MLLQPTCPFRKPERIRQAIDLLARPGTEGVVGVNQIARRLSAVYRECPDGFLEPLAPWAGQARRQDVPPLLTPNGTLYLTTREGLTRYRRLFPRHLRSLATDQIEGIDIDTLDDWTLAEAVVQAGLAKS
jgi:N-acylneuraminate cytidylyltransferase